MLKEAFVTKVRNITRTYGTGFYRATLLFPQSKKEDIWTLYAFVRIPDEMIDMQGNKEKAATDLGAWTEHWKAILNGKEVSEDVLIQTKKLFDTYSIPHEYSFAFLKAMEQDLHIARYTTYAELEDYMYGSAAVVGFMISHIIGFMEGGMPHARALGEAMQLTNILRDVKEDYEERGRIYIPIEDMEKFGVTENHIKNRVADDNWASLMKFEITRARALFAKGNEGIHYLERDGRKAVCAASNLYEKILDEIEAGHYDVFARRAVVSPFRKTITIMKILCKKNL